MNYTPRNLSSLPQKPGVYTFYNNQNRLLYIGKAGVLKNRVSSYFQRDLDSRVAAMVSQIKTIKVKETNSVVEALILEAQLIKKNQPKYNVRLKDDKSFSYLVLTKEDFPKFKVARETDLAKNHNYKKILGPYTSKKQLALALKIVRKIFPFHARNSKTEKGCLDFQIGLCPGPYANAISKTNYQKNIRAISMIFNGKMQILIGKLTSEMKKLSKKQKFEQAAEARNKIFALNHIQDVALVSSAKQKTQTENLKIEAYDISNISGKFCVGSMVVFTNGQPDKSQYRKFKIKTVAGINDVAAMQEVLTRRFRNNWPQPDLIILDGGQGHLNMASKLNLKVPIIAVAKGPTRKKLDIYCHPRNLCVGMKFKEKSDFRNKAYQAYGFCENQILTKEFTQHTNSVNKKIRAVVIDQQLLMRIRDEAHRFAITYHRYLRGKALESGIIPIPLFR